MNCHFEVTANTQFADTIDLQSPDSPSAKDHTRQPTHPVPLGDGPPAPHQAIALKHAEQEVEFHTRSPRMSQDLSNKELQLLHEDSDSFDSTNAAGPAHDLHSLQRNGISNGPVRDDADIGDLEGDDGSDDDMMDKISSSPSIEDGGSSLTLPWPDRGDSILSPLTPIEDAAPPPPRHKMLSSSPLLSPPTHFPPSYPQKEVASDPLKDHHHGGEYRTDRQDSGFNEDESTTRSHHYIKPLAFERDVSEFQVDFNNTIETYESDFDLRDINNLLLPADDPLLDNSFDDASLSPAAWDEDEKLDGQHHAHNNETGTDSDDDTEEFSYSDDSRFVDSGWGGECLREIEDIDFEFVYALHTFVATVEGQANATKGDTMVLLDDTNSYWWLVRVVKDESIGEVPVS